MDNNVGIDYVSGGRAGQSRAKIGGEMGQL